MARPCRRPGAWRLAAAAAGLAVLLLGACATVPDSGSVQQGTNAEAAVAGQDYLLQPIMVKPRPGSSPTQIVSAFLDATASFAGNYAAARQYLAPGVKWHPDGFAAVVIGPQATVSLNTCGCRQQPPTQNADMSSVVVKGDKLATVSSGGQYQASPEGDRYTWKFELRKIRGEWRIIGKPPSQPPLYEPDFQRAYLPRELYFVSDDGKSLVPDPVFVPLQATAVDVVKQLVTSLQAGPPDWLSGGTTSALSDVPSRASVTMTDGAAIVRLTMPAVLFSRLNVGEVQTQLAWTLASPSFAQSAVVQSVQLVINGYREQPVSWSGGHPEQKGPSVLSLPQIPAGQPLYSVVGHDVLQRLTPGSTPTRIPVHIRDDRAPLGAIAVSPGGRYVAWAAKRAVYYGPLKSGGKLTSWKPGADVTSVSWAPNGSLWVVAGGDVWMLQPYGPPSLLGGEPPGKVISMQIAPDGVRAVMIVKHHGTDQLMLGAIQSSGNAQGTAVSMGTPLSIGTDVPDPTQVAWYDQSNLIVLSQPAGGPLLQEVPVNGRNATALVTPQDIQSISSAGPANPLAAGLAGGRLALATSINSTWTATKNAGQHLTYAAG